MIAYHKMKKNTAHQPRRRTRLWLNVILLIRYEAWGTHYGNSIVQIMCTVIENAAHGTFKSYILNRPGPDHLRRTPPKRKTFLFEIIQIFVFFFYSRSNAIFVYICEVVHRECLNIRARCWCSSSILFSILFGFHSHVAVRWRHSTCSLFIHLTLICIHFQRTHIFSSVGISFCLHVIGLQQRCRPYP